MNNFSNTSIILSHLNAHGINVLSADDFSIKTPHVEIKPEYVWSTVTGELLAYIELDRKKPDFNDLYPEDLADADILYLIINEHEEELKKYGVA